MSTLKFTTMPVAETATPLAALGGVRAPAPSAVDHVVISGARWLIRPRFQSVLEKISADVWRDPHAHGWQMVKRNTLRSVWRFSIDGNDYYIKCFRRAGYRDAIKNLFGTPPWQAEWQGGLYAAAARIPAPEMLALCESIRIQNRRCAVLVSEALDASIPLNEFWRSVSADPDRRRRREDVEQLSRVLAEMLARAHQAGFEHRDMHAENILVQPIGPRRYRTAFVDLQCARLNVAVSDSAVVRNLAQLNQWFRRHAGVKERLRFLRSYFRQRLDFEAAFTHGRRLGLSFEGLVAALIPAAERHAERLWSQRDRRVRRVSKYFAPLRVGGWRGAVFLESKHESEESTASTLELTRTWWNSVLKKPLSLFATAEAQCKDSHSASVARVALRLPDGGVLPVIAKRPRARNWQRALRHLFGPSRSLRAWRMGYALLNRDIATARPLAYLERRLGPLRLDSLVLTEAIPDAIDLESFLTSGLAGRNRPEVFRLKLELGRLLAAQLRLLHQRRFIHRDCKASNLLVVTRPRLKLLWIDMDGLRRTRQVSLKDELAALTRLHVSLVDLPEITHGDRARMLREYLTHFGADPHEWRTIWRQVAAEAAEKQSELSKRRAWKQRHYGRT